MFTFQYSPEHPIRDDIIDAQVPVSLDRDGHYSTQMAFTHHYSGRNKDISEDIRKSVADAHRDGKCYNFISKEFRLQHCMVRTMMYRWRKFKNIAGLPGSHWTNNDQTYHWQRKGLWVTPANSRGKYLAIVSRSTYKVGLETKNQRTIDRIVIWKGDGWMDGNFCQALVLQFASLRILFFSSGAAPQEEMASLIPVKNTKTLLISAYLEHRTGKKEVSDAFVSMRCSVTCS